MANELTKDDLRRFARLGAMRRLDDMRKEEASIRASFPELFDDVPPRRGGRPKATPAAAGVKPARAAKAAKTGRARKRSTMSPAMRKEVSERMKKYWAGRRKAKNA